jgi:GMP synthase-like glutamine amidotransferase
MGLKAHWLQHAPFEGLGSIQEWLARRHAEVSSTRFFDSPALPSIDDVDLLIVMGGPMSVNDENAYPWLKTEKQLIRRAIDSGTPVLGICLGAQLIAAALGAAVRRAAHREIGWFAVERVAAGPPRGAQAVLPDRLEAFHWHGETFDLPRGARHLARNEACENQAFAVGENVIAFQFHLEATPESAAALVESCRADLAPGRFVQSGEAILGAPGQFRRINSVMDSVLDALMDLMDRR